MRAMVLCAGYGTRLGKLTRRIPKPMLPLNGHPLLEYIICHLSSQGFDQIAINLHFMPEIIRSYFGDGSHWNVTLTYSCEPELLGTAGGVKKMEKFLCNEDAFLIHYGDILTDQDFAAMLSFHRKKRSLATLLLHQRKHSNSMVRMDGNGRIVGFIERPAEQTMRKDFPWVNSGICICDPELLNSIPENIPCDLPGDVFPELISSGRLYGFPLSGYRCAIDSPQRLEEARSALAEQCCRFSFQGANVE